jgi:hypothetical protein
MSIQEQEDVDFVGGSEAQNCLAEAAIACAMFARGPAAKIAALVSAGRVVVVRSDPYHCRSTDAIAGTIRVPLADFAVRSEAEAYINGNADFANDSDSSYSILPARSAPATPVAAAAELLF